VPHAVHLVIARRSRVHGQLHAERLPAAKRADSTQADHPRQRRDRLAARTGIHPEPGAGAARAGAAAAADEKGAKAAAQGQTSAATASAAISARMSASRRVERLTPLRASP